MPDAAHSHSAVFLHIPQSQTQQGREALAKPPSGTAELERLFLGLFLFSGLSSWFKPFSRLCTLFLQPALAPIRTGQSKHLMVLHESPGETCHLHTATCPIPSGYQAGQREECPRILTQHCFNSKGWEAARSSCPPPGSRDSAWRRLPSSWKAEGAGSWHCHLCTQLPRVANPAPRRG